MTAPLQLLEKVNHHKMCIRHLNKKIKFWGQYYSIIRKTFALSEGCINYPKETLPDQEFKEAMMFLTKTMAPIFDKLEFASEADMVSRLMGSYSTEDSKLRVIKALIKSIWSERPYPRGLQKTKKETSKNRKEDRGSHKAEAALPWMDDG